MEIGNWEILIQEINNGRCILVLGPETSIVELQGKKKCSRELLLEKFTAGLSNKEDSFALEDFHTTSLIYQDNKSISKGKLLNEISNFYKNNFSESNEILENLAQLPFPLIVNATPDNRIINYLKKQNKDVVESYYNYRGKKQQLKWKYNYDSFQNILVYNLYGDVKEPISLVVTEDDLLEYIIHIIEKNPPLPTSITSIVQDEKISFLFLGFGFKSWYLRILLYVLLGRKERVYDSVALEDFSFFPSHKRKLTSIFYKRLYNITFDEDLKLSEFVDELLKKYKKSKDSNITVKKPVKPPQTKAPKVFICHTSEDKEYAMKLYVALEEKGIEPWLDKKKLLGGDNWSKVIEKEIENIDYFLILNSRSLYSKNIGYVNKEIKLALQTQLKYREKLRFIIPLEIDDGEQIEELKALHFLKLDSPDDVDEIVNTIEIDQKLRLHGKS